MAAAWPENDALGVQTAADERSAADQPSVPVYDPFDEDDRLVQLPDDPFDEPVGESIPAPEPEADPEEDFSAVEDALEKEIKRRRSEDDLPGDEMQRPRGIGTLEDDPLDEIGMDDLGEIDRFGDDATVEDMLRSAQDDKEMPDLGLDFDQDNQAEADDIAPTPEELAERAKELANEQRESEESCREKLEEIDADRISAIDLSIRVDGNAGEDFPYECAFSSKSHQPRQWPQITYNWKAAALCHKPLYFQQVQLERYGHSWGPYVQPIMSGVHFFGTLPVLPYKMGIRTPTECVYTLGYYRPGSCAPYMIDPIPFTWRAALLEGAAATGISFIIP